MGKVVVYHRPGETKVEVCRKLSRYFNSRGITEAYFDDADQRYLVLDKDNLYRVGFRFTTCKTKRDGSTKSGTLELRVEYITNLPSEIEEIVTKFGLRKSYALRASADHTEVSCEN